MGRAWGQKGAGRRGCAVRFGPYAHARGRRRGGNFEYTQVLLLRFSRRDHGVLVFWQACQCGMKMIEACGCCTSARVVCVRASGWSPPPRQTCSRPSPLSDCEGPLAAVVFRVFSVMPIISRAWVRLRHQRGGAARRVSIVFERLQIHLAASWPAGLYWPRRCIFSVRYDRPHVCGPRGAWRHCAKRLCMHSKLARTSPSWAWSPV